MCNVDMSSAGQKATSMSDCGSAIGSGGATLLSGSSPFPEEELALMLRKDLGIHVDSQALRIFVRWRWDRVTTLAHKIHKGG